MNNSYATAYEIHVHGAVPLQEGVDFAQLEDVLKPLWQYTGANGLTRGARSFYEEEPGIRFDAHTRMLSMCWTLEGNDDFRQALDHVCMNLNEVAATGAALELSFYDVQFDEDEAGEDDESKDDFFVLFVGPTPAHIMQVQRDMLVQDVGHIMERHFEQSEMGDVYKAIDEMFEKRFNAMVGALDLSKIMKGPGPGGHGAPRSKNRHGR
jgi:hypothetical protein